VHDRYRLATEPEFRQDGSRGYFLFFFLLRLFLRL
jgi:hypothetical protein